MNTLIFSINIFIDSLTFEYFVKLSDITMMFLFRFESMA